MLKVLWKKKNNIYSFKFLEIINYKIVEKNI